MTKTERRSRDLALLFKHPERACPSRYCSGMGQSGMLSCRGCGHRARRFAAEPPRNRKACRYVVQELNKDSDKRIVCREPIPDPVRDVGGDCSSNTDQRDETERPQ
jgi:hypothetical protein